MTGAMVIAGQAAGTRAIVLPLRKMGGTEPDIARGAHLLAFSAMDAKIAVYGKFTVANHVAIEVGAYHMTERPGRLVCISPVCRFATN